MYSIKAVTSMTGLNAETLRAWERRYSAVTPLRDNNGRRIYTHQDIERLTLLHNAKLAGYSISKLAKLENIELQDLLAKSNESTGLNSEILHIQVIDMLMQYRLDSCEELLRRALIAMDPISYSTDFLIPILRKIGDLWHEGRISIAQEHIFTCCVKRIVLSLVNNMMPFSSHQTTLIFSTPSGEQHEFGILLSCLIAAHQGCTCYYLGPDLPTDELISAQQHLQSDIIVLSLVNTSPIDSLYSNLDVLFSALPSQAEIWIGGAGTKPLIENNHYNNQLKLINDLNDFNSKLKLLNTQPSRN